jgi:hypothetical protein
MYFSSCFHGCNRDSHIPNPVKMIRRLTALELAMGQLRKDCETISKKRKDIVKSVVSKQNDNVENVQKVSEMRRNIFLGDAKVFVCGLLASFRIDTVATSRHSSSIKRTTVQSTYKCR